MTFILIVSTAVYDNCEVMSAGILISDSYIITVTVYCLSEVQFSTSMRKTLRRAHFDNNFQRSILASWSHCKLLCSTRHCMTTTFLKFSLWTCKSSIKTNERFSSFILVSCMLSCLDWTMVLQIILQMASYCIIIKWNYKQDTCHCYIVLICYAYAGHAPIL